MRDRNLLRRAVREFAKNLAWMVVAFGALATILVAATSLPLVGAMAFVGAAAAVMAAIVTGVVIGSNAHAHDESSVGWHHYPGGSPGPGGDWSDGGGGLGWWRRRRRRRWGRLERPTHRSRCLATTFAVGCQVSSTRA
jgi:hypothetical protein